MYVRRFLLIVFLFMKIATANTDNFNTLKKANYYTNSGTHLVADFIKMQDDTIY